jgi:hypothetical protein
LVGLASLLLALVAGGCGGTGSAAPATTTTSGHPTPPPVRHEPPTKKKVLDSWETFSRLAALGSNATYFSTPCVAYESGRSCVATLNGQTQLTYIVPSGADRYHVWVTIPALNETQGDRVLSGERIVASLDRVTGGGSSGGASGGTVTVYMPSYGGPSSERPAPSAFVIGNTSRRGFTWSGWGSPRAIGRGEVETNSCTPSCAAGSVTWVPEKIVLTHIVVCQGRRFYGQIGPRSARTGLDMHTCAY